MARTFRTGLLVAGVAVLAAAVLLPPGPGAADSPPPPPPPDKKDRPPADADKAPGGGEALLLPTDRQVKRRLEAAADYLKTGSWGEAVRLLQQVLDAPEDAFIPRPQAGRPATWASARAEALRLLADLPPEGREFYQVRYGAAAKARLQEARTRSDPDLLEEVVRRYPYTAAGLEALELLGTHELDRGRFADAAAWFRLLVERRPADQLSPVTLYKAALAFRHGGDRAAAEHAWQQLTARAGGDSVHLGSQTVRLDQLRAEMEHLPVRSMQAGDFPQFRGDARRSGQAAGGVPYWEPRWQRPTADRPETLAWLRAALHAQQEGMQPSVPGACPILVGGRLVYRGGSGLAAVDPATGYELWRADLPLSFDACMRTADSAQRKVSIESWLRMYAPSGAPAGNVVVAFAPGGMNAVPGAEARPLPYAPPLLFENTAQGTLSSDGRRVYAVEDLPVPPPPALLQERPGVRHPLGPLGPRVRYNRLLAFDAATGRPAWERGGEEVKAAGKKPPAQAGPEDELAGCYFLGPPLPLSGRLYALVEKQGEVVLFCLDAARGGVVWSQPLATVREKLSADVGRRLQAVHLAYADGVLVCPTNAGAVLGVDPLARTLLWAYAYHAPAAGDGGAAPAQQPAIAPDTGPAWKASAPILHDGKVILTTADDTSLYCLRLRDGTPLWKRPRTDDDLYVAGVRGDRVVIVGRTACTAAPLDDGTKTAWSVATGRPSGLGVLGGDVLYLPLQKGAVVALDVRKGVVVAEAEVRGGVPGNLLFHDGDLLSQSATALAAYPQLKGKLAALEARLGKDPRDPAGLAERGGLRLHEGDLAGAVADLRLALATGPAADRVPAVREQLYEALTRLLRRDFRAGARYLDEYRELCRVPVPEGADAATRRRLEAERQQRQTNLLCLLARGRELQAGPGVDVLRAYLDLAGRDAGDELVPSLDDPAVRDRLDVWVRGRVAALFAGADARQARALHEEVARRWQVVRAGEDPAALERFAALFGPVSAEGREARLLLAERWLADRDHGRGLEAELVLLRLRREADDPALAARATEALARLLTGRGLLDDALHYYRILARDYRRVEVRDGKTGADFLEELRADRRFLPYLEPPVPWAGGRIRAEKPAGAGSGVVDHLAAPLPGAAGPTALTFQFRGERTPFLEGHVLILDLPTSRLRLLDRPTGVEVWSERLDLGHVRGFLVNAGLAGSVFPCPVLGHLAVVDLGAEVLGVDLLDRRVAWRRAPVDGPFLPDRMAVGPCNDDPEKLQLVGLDRFGRGQTTVLGRLGPYTAECVLLQTAGGLVALDPARGTTRWVRGDVAADAAGFGDDRDVYLVERGGTATRALRGLDGAVAADVPRFAEVYPQKLAVLGGRLLVSPAGDGGDLRLYDVPSGKNLWRTAVPPGAVLLQSADPYLAGWVGRDGQVAVVDLHTYRRVLDAHIDPAHVAGVHEARLLTDARRFYLAFQGDSPANAPPVGDPVPCVAGMRCVPVNGMVYAFDRATGAVDWFNRVANQMLLTEQFEQLPIVLFAGGLNRSVGGNVVQSVQVLSMDKQTGKRLLAFTAPNTTTVFHTLQVDVRARTIDLIGVNFRIRHFEAAKK